MSQIYKVGSHKTSVLTENGITKVVYHETAVVKFDNKHITLNSGGWRTATTKTRMNQTSNQFDLGFQVFQKDFDWFVDYKNKTIPFEDSMILSR